MDGARLGAARTCPHGWRHCSRARASSAPLLRRESCAAAASCPVPPCPRAIPEPPALLCSPTSAQGLNCAF
eukprot:6207271-Pleurochrysis_carterae.AAC.3